MHVELTYSTRTAVLKYALRQEEEVLTHTWPLCTDIKFVTERLERKSILNFIEIRSAVSNTKHALRQQAFPVELRYMLCFLADELKESVVGTVARLPAGRPGVRMPAEARGSPLLKSVQTGSGAQSALCSIGTGGSSGVKRPEP